MCGQAITSTRATVNDNVASFSSEANKLHNNTVDKITQYEDKYLPYAHKYDK